MIWFSSDYHFSHDKPFVYSKRGFSSIYAMNEAIVKRHNELVKPEDSVYFLGDAFLGGKPNESLNLLKRLNGEFFWITGNHDTDNKRELILNNLYNWHEIGLVTILKINGLRFYLSHYPTITSELIETKQLKSRTICLHGHTHSQNKFYENKNPYVYNCALDAHDCRPVSIDQIIKDIMKKEDEINR